MTPSQTHSEPIRIHGDRDADRQVILRPEDNDAFVQTGKQVIEACRLGISIDVWIGELRDMLDAVRDWAAGHADHVARVYGSPRPGRVALFFVPKLQQFDFDLADGLSELNSTIVKTFNVGMVELSQIPPGEVDRFVDPESTTCIYAADRGPRPAVEA